MDKESEIKKIECPDCNATLTIFIDMLDNEIEVIKVKHKV